MVTYFNRKDLVEFGNYLLSEERKEHYRNHPEADCMPPLEDRLSEVNHADVENWIHWKRIEKNGFDNLYKHLKSVEAFDKK